ncbi:MAG: histidine--tRNA ligase [Chloroflexi bacterium]|nr:histidine--tRNA ligase [Chloroflexota bacterium]
MFQAPRGTNDILPEEQPYWRYVERVAAAVAGLYGYERIDSPVFEDTGLFTRSVGAGTDIVEKEMYTFEDKGGNSVTLRPEGTAPVCRAYLEHGLFNRPQPVKLCYFAAIFRYERPQAGRLREHHQFGCEAIGEADPALDAEVIDTAWRFFRTLGLRKLSLQLNSIGDRHCRPAYIELLKHYYAARAGELCPDCTARVERNPLRLLDCKNPRCQAIAAEAPKSVEHLCPDCAAHFARLTACLGLLNIPYNINHRLVRGLDYYTRTVFEVQPEAEGGQSTLGGGGRYDDLIAELGGKPTPAIGFGAGIERIIANLKREGVAVPPAPAPRVYIAALGDDAARESVRLAARLREDGFYTLTAFGGRSLKAQLRAANNFSARFTLILGDEEVRTGRLTVRDMSGGGQFTLDAAGLAGWLRARE